MTAPLKRRKPNQKRAQETRARLLESAEELLSKEGFSSLTSRRLAKQADISVGVIYDYFPSMQALMYWIYEVRLKKRVEIFDATMMGDNLEKPLKETFPAYLARMQTEHMWSQLDLELDNAAESDAKFGELIAQFREELTDRFCAMFEARGSSLSKAELRRLAAYSHAVDHASLRLQRNSNKDGKAFYGELTTRVDLMLMQRGGILDYEEVEELIELLVAD